MYTYVVRDLKTAKQIEGFLLLQLSTPAMVGSKLKKDENLYEIKEIAHTLDGSSIERSHTILYLEKIW